MGIQNHPYHYKYCQVMHAFNILSSEVSIVFQFCKCDQIWEKPACTHTTARHTFHHRTIAVHVD